MNPRAPVGESPRVLVCFAVKEEANAFRRSQVAREVDVVLTGMGRANARSGFLAFLEHTQPSLVLTCGFAGALDPALATGDLVFSCDENSRLNESFLRIGAKPVHFFCAEKVASSAREKAMLRERTGCDAVEMESGVIRGLCEERNIPSAALRVISDAAHEDLPVDFNKFMSARQELILTRLILFLVTHPGRISGLLRLQKVAQSGGRILSNALECLLIELSGDRGSKRLC